MRKETWLGLAAALLAGCQSHETSQGGDALKAAVSPIAGRWEGWMAAGQADSIANVFTEQGREMPPNMPAVVGRVAIKAYEARNAAMFAAKLTIRPESFAASGPLGVERGSYTFEGKAKAGAPKGTPAAVSDEGKYLIHWSNVDGHWQVAELIWNPNRPPMMGHAAAPAKKPAAHGATKTKKK
jgi:ketosteroid isomerase-like protein